MSEWHWGGFAKQSAFVSIVDIYSHALVRFHNAQKMNILSHRQSERHFARGIAKNILLEKKISFDLNLTEMCC